MQIYNPKPAEDILIHEQANAMKPFPTFFQLLGLILITVILYSVTIDPFNFLDRINNPKVDHVNAFLRYSYPILLMVIYPVYIYSRKKKAEPDFKFPIAKLKWVTVLWLAMFVVLNSVLLISLSTLAGLDVFTSMFSNLNYQTPAQITLSLILLFASQLFISVTLHGMVLDGLLKNYGLGVSYLGLVMFMWFCYVSGATPMILIQHFIGMLLLKKTGNQLYNLIWALLFAVGIIICKHIMTADEWLLTASRITWLEIAILLVGNLLTGFLLFRSLPISSRYDRKNQAGIFI